MAFAPSSSTEPLIAAQFAVDVTRPLPGAGGGLPAFAATDRRGDRSKLMAVQPRLYLPARAEVVRQLTGITIEGLLTPLAQGAIPLPGGEGAGFVICGAPPGPAVDAQRRPWPETELISQVLRPVARALDQLDQRGLTHRAVRADNVFRAGPGHPVVLGCAWASPPAALQPAAAEPAYIAMCHPAARGEGSIADDVYGLGVLLLTLALGRPPLADLSDGDIIQRKLDHGSHAALIGDNRLTSFLDDLLRGMLAEDPEHRPPPSLLLDSAAARSRRIAARPPHRAQQPIQLGNLVCWHARGLAYALATQPVHGLRALKTGVIDQWLRRSLGDGVLAAHLDDRVGTRGQAGGEEAGRVDSLALMSMVALLDPLAPLCWDGMALWPDGLGALLAASRDPDNPAGKAGGAETMALVSAMVAADAPVIWGGLREDRCDAFALRTETRQVASTLRLAAPAGGALRLVYQMNPLLPCLSPGVRGRWVAHMADLLPALEASARGATPTSAPIDAHVAAFIAARGDRKLESEVTRLGQSDDSALPLAQLRLLAHLQARHVGRPLPNLGAWVAGQMEALLASWRSRQRRAALRPRLRELADQGELVALLALLDDTHARQADETDALRAVEELMQIDSALAALASGGPQRAEQARRLGQEVAVGVSVAALAVMLMAAVLG